MSTVRKVKPTALRAADEYVLRLYVAGQTPKSLQAFANLKEICETHLHGDIASR